MNLYKIKGQVVTGGILIANEGFAISIKCFKCVFSLETIQTKSLSNFIPIKI